VSSEYFIFMPFTHCCQMRLWLLLCIHFLHPTMLFVGRLKYLLLWKVCCCVPYHVWPHENREDQMHLRNLREALGIGILVLSWRQSRWIPTALFYCRLYSLLITTPLHCDCADESQEVAVLSKALKVVHFEKSYREKYLVSHIIAKRPGSA